MQNTLVNVDFSHQELACIRRALDVCIHDSSCGLDASKLQMHLDDVQRKMDNTSAFANASCTLLDDDVFRYVAAVDFLKRGVISYNNDGHESAINIDELQTIIDKFNDARKEAQSEQISRMQS